ncbi:MAG: PQQ-binding-like beta-propeller repeat protein [Pedobacter sp.]|uniref:outer membrane protein assembly factor BamB family protein n=1 Tax=Pedobacter sp. TaxID=1411316 RepID=UPI003395ED7E
MAITKTKAAITLILAAGIAVCTLYFLKKKNNDWQVYGGSTENIKYSSLNQIDTSNVAQLKVAWVYHAENSDTSRYGIMECNPVIIGNTLYGVSPKMKLFAVDAASGKEKWHFDPADSVANKTWHRNSVNMNRGVTYWSEGSDKRIIYTVGPVAFAVNAETGKLVPGFGTDGGIDLRKGLGRDEEDLSISPTSPVLIYKDLFIVSGAVSETTPGHIRAFDVKTGEQKWIFHTVPYPGEPGFETWDDPTAYKRMGSANAWSGFSLDSKTGLMFAGVGSPTNDFYGGDRSGNGLYGNSIVAIDAATGKLKWHFQAIHHDVWDMDISSPPVLVTLTRDGKKVDAVVQTTKTGLIFVFDRNSGKPLFPIVEKPVPLNGAVEGEHLSKTQPFPVLPKPFVRTIMTEKDLNHLGSDSSYEDIKRRFQTYRSEGIYTPPTEKGTIILPGYDGGANWGGPAVDPETNILYINANEMAWVLNMVKDTASGKKEMTNQQAAALLYNKNCMGCHGPERLGSGDYPSLIGVGKKYNLAQFNELLSTGRRMMPGFNHLSKDEKHALATLVLDAKYGQDKPYKGPPIATANTSSKPSFTFTGYNKFLTKDGYPALSPPWGTISAINLNTGKYVWKVPFGEFEELKKKGIPATGRENFGGPVVTAGGLLFIGASADGYFRAINKKTGKTLWQTKLPAAAMSTPAIYEQGGKQYVVIACGGGKSGGKSGDSYVAFTL